MICRALLLLFLLLPLPAAAAPQRIASLAPSVTELLFALDCGGRVVARTASAAFPPEAERIPAVGSYDLPSAEKVLALRPDLCVGVSDGTPPAFVRKMEEAGVPVMLLDIPSIDALPRALRGLGSALGAEDRAEALASQAERRLEGVDRVVAETRNTGRAAPSVLVLVQGAPAIAASRQTFLGSLVTRAGGVCPVEAQGRLRYPVLGREALAALAPDIVLSCTMDDGADRPAVAEDAAEGPCSGLGPGRMWRVPPDIFARPSLRALDALDMLVRIFCDADVPQGQGVSFGNRR